MTAHSDNSPAPAGGVRDALEEAERLLARMRREGTERVFLRPQTWQNLCQASPKGNAPRNAQPHPQASPKQEPVDMPRSPATSSPSAPDTSAMPDRSLMDWETLREAVRTCTLCPLREGRTNTVFGEGDPNADLMFIGEGPGAEEDAQGRPFVGRAGQLLTKMIEAMQFTREEVFIANIVKCRPPGNRVPEKEEAACCVPYLIRQIELIQPKVLVLLGNTSLKHLLDKTGITRLHGEWLDFRGTAVMPTFHPSFLLRDPRQKRPAWEDLQKVMAKLGKSPR